MRTVKTEKAVKADLLNLYFSFLLELFTRFKT